jgi:hypothetical protein
MNYLKPNIKKVLLSLTVIILFVSIVNYLSLTGSVCDCLGGGFDYCTDYNSFSILYDSCHCGCSSISDIFLEYLEIILPGFLVYLIYSLVEFIKNKN